MIGVLIGVVIIGGVFGSVGLAIAALITKDEPVKQIPLDEYYLEGEKEVELLLEQYNNEDDNDRYK
jgi:hypothetical protein